MRGVNVWKEPLLISYCFVVDGRPFRPNVAFCQIGTETEETLSFGFGHGSLNREDKL
jgi:hypothetical protein